VPEGNVWNRESRFRISGQFFVGQSGKYLSILELEKIKLGKNGVYAFPKSNMGDCECSIVTLTAVSQNISLVIAK